jgi:hypothetical protein
MGLRLGMRWDFTLPLMLEVAICDLKLNPILRK